MADIFDIMDKEDKIITIKEFEKLLEEKLEKLLFKYGLLTKHETEPVWVNMKQLCEEIKISKPTINKWFKEPFTRTIFEPFRKQVGKRVVFDISGLKLQIRRNLWAFKKGNQYEFCEALLSDEEKKEKKYNSIAQKMFNDEEVTKEEKAFYKTNKARYGDDLNK